MSKHSFFKAMADQHLALSFDDVRLKSGYSEISPAEAKVETRFSRNIDLKQPIVSSPMDTVTEAKMAIAMAKLGGLGVIHRSLPPTEQASEVGRVKFYLNALIEKPICVYKDQSIREIEEKQKQKDRSFQTFPVVDSKGFLIGLVTKNDMELALSRDSLVKDFMTPKDRLLTAPEGTDLETAYKLMQSNKRKVIPLVDSKDRLKGMYVLSDVKRVAGGNQAGFNLDNRGHLRVAASVGVGEQELERAELLVEREVDALVVDTAHGDSLKVIETVKALKKKFGDKVDVMAGNVSEGDSAKRLVEAGADAIRVGQGPGSICTTRIIAGIGCPQVSAIYNCAQAVEGSGVPVCADGGINNSGDVVIAMAAGAHSVMLGRLLAGTNESPGEVVTIQGMPYKTYRGMGSLGAMQSSVASRQRYGGENDSKDKLVPEGIEGAVPYKGSLAQVMHQYVEGLRRGMGYVGAEDIPQLHQKADFHRISASGLKESHPHHIHITKEAPNYNSQN